MIKNTVGESTHLNPPVAGSTVINSHSTVGQRVAKSAAMHMTERCYCLRGGGYRDSTASDTDETLTEKLSILN